MDTDPGTYKIKCVNAGGYVLSGYGQYAFDEGEEVDLVSPETPVSLRAQWNTADTMCRDQGFEIAQLIAAGIFIVTERRRPDLTLVLAP